MPKGYRLVTCVPNAPGSQGVGVVGSNHASSTLLHSTFLTIYDLLTLPVSSSALIK